MTSIYLLFEYKMSQIEFPVEEHNDIIFRLNSKGDIITTRISDDYYRFKKGNILKSNVGYKLKIMKINKFKGIDNHPFKEYLTDEQKQLIGDNNYIIMYLKRI